MVDLAHSQRDAIKQISPPWLADGNGEKFLYNIGLIMDAMLEKMNQSMQARMPGRGDNSALPLIGNDRLMSQGPSEPDALYATRLQKAFDAWQRAGARRAILQQLLGYVANALNVQTAQKPVGAIVGTGAAGTYSTWDVFFSTSDTAKPPAHAIQSPSNWNWDGSYTWWQAFLILYFPIVLSTTTGVVASVTANAGGFSTITGLTGMSTSSVGGMLVITGAASSANNGTFQIASFISSTSVTIANPSGVAGDANNGAIHWTFGTYPAIGPAPAFGTPGFLIGDTTKSIGLNQTAGYVTGMRNLLRLWKSANSFYPWMIISFAGGDGTSSTEFAPTCAIGAGNPDGTWGTWAKTVAGVSVASRSTGVDPGKFDAFCDGTAIYLNSYTPSAT